MLSRLDSWLLNAIFEPLQRKIQINYGVICFSVAKMLFIIELIVLVISTTWFMLTETMLVLSAAAIIATYTCGKQVCSSLDTCARLLKKYDTLSDNTEMNSLRMTYEKARLIMLFGSGIIWMFIPWFYNPFSVGLCVIFSLDFVALYFLSCTPLPPQKNKALVLATNPT